jgi:hypothetical protein
MSTCSRQDTGPRSTIRSDQRIAPAETLNRKAGEASRPAESSKAVAERRRWRCRVVPQPAGHWRSEGVRCPGRRRSARRSRGALKIREYEEKYVGTGPTPGMLALQPGRRCRCSVGVLPDVQPTPPTAARSPRPTEPAWFGSVHVPQLGHEVPVPRRSGRSYAPPSGRVLQLKPARTILGAQALQLARRYVTQGLPGSAAEFAMHHAGYPI